VRPPSCHPEERSDEGSAPTEVAPSVGEIPPLPLRFARGRVRDDTPPCHPEERSDEGSAPTGVAPSLGEIPPLATLAFGMTGNGGGVAFGMTGSVRRVRVRDDG